MKVLLDECLDWRLSRDLAAHDVKTVNQVGLERLKNGELLSAAASDFDVFVTLDSKLPYQQQIAALQMGVIVLRARTTRLPDLRELLPQLIETIVTIRQGEIRILRWRS